MAPRKRPEPESEPAYPKSDAEAAQRVINWILDQYKALAAELIRELGLPDAPDPEFSLLPDDPAPASWGDLTPRQRQHARTAYLLLQDIRLLRRELEQHGDAAPLAVWLMKSVADHAHTLLLREHRKHTNREKASSGGKPKAKKVHEKIHAPIVEELRLLLEAHQRWSDTQVADAAGKKFGKSRRQVARIVK